MTLVDLRVAGQGVGTMRMRARSPIQPVILRLVAILLASEVERVRAPQRASQEATTAFLHATLAGELTDRANIPCARRERSASCSTTARRSSSPAPTRLRRSRRVGARVLAAAERGARAAAPGAAAALTDRETSRAEVVVVVPGVDEDHSRRTADAVLRELAAALPGHTFAVGRSRAAVDPLELPRAGNEALLAANVAGGEPEVPVLAFEETGAYRLLLSAMSETGRAAALLRGDGRAARRLRRAVRDRSRADGRGLARQRRQHRPRAKLFTHRHTIRYRLERVRELSGLDVGSTDGREKLSLGLKAMRVLGVTTPAGRVSEARGAGGRVLAHGGEQQAVGTVLSSAKTGNSGSPPATFAARSASLPAEQLERVDRGAAAADGEGTPGSAGRRAGAARRVGGAAAVVPVDARDDDDHLGPRGLAIGQGRGGAGGCGARSALRGGERTPTLLDRRKRVGAGDDDRRAVVEHEADLRAARKDDWRGR